MKKEQRVKNAVRVWAVGTHPKRFAILELLSRREEVQAQEIQHKFKIPQSQVSHHMGLLRREGFVFSKGKRGRWRKDPVRYTLNVPRHDSLMYAIDLLNKK